MSPRNHAVDGSPDPQWKGHFVGDTCQPIVTHLRMSAFCIVRLPPLANVPAQRTRRTNVIAAARDDKRRCGLLPNYSVDL